MCPSTRPRGSVADRDAYQVMGIFCKDAGVDFDGSMCSWEGGQVQEHFAVSMLLEAECATLIALPTVEMGWLPCRPNI